MTRVGCELVWARRFCIGMVPLLVSWSVAAGSFGNTRSGVEGADAPQESLSRSSGNIEKRGRELQAALRNAYHQLRSSGKLAGLNTDVTSYVLPYLPPGISFEEAEMILADAGFALGPHPGPDQANNPNRATDWYAVLARISPFVEDPPNKVSVYVTLLPKSPGDYLTVDKLTASFFISGP